MRFWTEEEDEYLKQNCGKISYKEMALYLDRKPGAIRTRVYNLNLSPKKRGPKPAISLKPWTEKELDYLRANIRDKKYSEMKRLIANGRTEKAIAEKAKSLGLVESKKRLPWSQEEDDYLLKNYGELSYSEIQNELSDRTVKAIQARAMKLLSLIED